MNTVFDRRLTVAICDTQPLLVEGLQALFAKSTSYSLLEPARTLEMLSYQIVTAAPRVAIIDKTAGTSEILEWLRKMASCGNTASVIWGMTVTDSEAVRFLQAGARGVLRKTAGPEMVLACLDSVANGTTWMDDDLFRAAGAPPVASTRSDLTAREQQVLELVERGMRNKEIARELGIRPGTVKIHLKHIFEKSGVRGRYGLALSGLRDRFHPVALSA